MKLTNLMIDEIIKNALKEDMPYGDVSTDSLFLGDETSSARLIAKENGVAAGLAVAARVFELIDADTVFSPLVNEGAKVEAGTIMAEISGKTSSLLKAERVALNFLQRMCGIATKTRRMSELAAGSGTVIADTRKTTPNLRILEKYAVYTGGGANHRFSLSDAVMLKDNHIKAVGSINTAVKKARKAISHTMKIEVETETLEQVKEAVVAGVDIIMLDNMDRKKIEAAVAIIGGKAIIEVSGNLTEDNIKEKLVAGVDVMSSGGLTHSVKAMDISMRFV